VDGQNETKQPDHSASLGDSITSSTRIGFSVHTPISMIPGTTHPMFEQAPQKFYEIVLEFLGT
jgi:hypothetical protein